MTDRTKDLRCAICTKTWDEHKTVIHGFKHDPRPRYTCFVDGCPSNHVSKHEVCTVSSNRLLERLRSPLGNFDHPHEANQRRAQSLCTEAADEIERQHQIITDKEADCVRLHKAFMDLKYPETSTPDEAQPPASNLVAQMREAAAEQEKHYSLLEDGADWIDRASTLLPLIQRDVGTELARETSALLAQQPPQPKQVQMPIPANSKSIWVWLDQHYGLRAATVKPSSPSVAAVEYAPVSSQVATTADVVRDAERTTSAPLMREIAKLDHIVK